MRNTARRLSLAIALLAVLGVGVSSVSLDHHFRKSKTSYCDFGESFNCDLVNRSEYSTVAGVPVALIGIVRYAGLLAFAMFYRAKAGTPAVLVLDSVCGLGFALYLTYVEKFILSVWCIVCLSSLVVIFSITILSVFLLVHSMRPSAG